MLGSIRAGDPVGIDGANAISACIDVKLRMRRPMGAPAALAAKVSFQTFSRQNMAGVIRMAPNLKAEIDSLTTVRLYPRSGVPSRRWPGWRRVAATGRALRQATHAVGVDSASGCRNPRLPARPKARRVRTAAARQLPGRAHAPAPAGSCGPGRTR